MIDNKDDWVTWLLLGGAAGFFMAWWIAQRRQATTLSAVALVMAGIAPGTGIKWIDRRVLDHQPLSGGDVVDIYPSQGDVLDLETDSADFGGADESDIIPRIMQPDGSLRAKPFGIEKG